MGAKASVSLTHLLPLFHVTVLITNDLVQSKCVPSFIHQWAPPPGLSMVQTTAHFIKYLPGGSDGKESACNSGDLGSIPGSGRSPREGNGYSLQYSYLENSMDRRARWVPVVHGVAKSQIQLPLLLSTYKMPSLAPSSFHTWWWKQGCQHSHSRDLSIHYGKLVNCTFWKTIITKFYNYNSSN